jgi:hypothetical protein
MVWNDIENNCGAILQNAADAGYHPGESTVYGLLLEG